jgi:multidrug resistance efflux pump
MAKRIVPIAVIALVAAGLLLASRWQRTPPKVSGFIEADEIRLGSRVGGRVAKVFVEEGDRVSAGTTLVELEPFDLLAREAQARANLASRKAEYEKFTAGFRAEEIIQARQRAEQLRANHQRLVKGPRPQEIDAGKAQLEVAQAQLELAQQTYNRTKELYERNATSGVAMDQAIEGLKAAQGMVLVRQKELDLLNEGTRQEDLDAAEAQLKEAEAALAMMEKGYRQEEIAQAKAAVDAAQAAIDVILEQEKELRITALVDGAIESMELEPGDLAGAGAPVMSMIDTGKLWVRAYLPEDFSLDLGQKVEVSVDAYPDERFAAEVTFIARQAEFTPSNVQTPEERSKQVFRIKVTLTEGLDRLRPGMAADVWLPPQGERP